MKISNSFVQDPSLSHTQAWEIFVTELTEKEREFFTLGEHTKFTQPSYVVRCVICVSPPRLANGHVVPSYANEDPGYINPITADLDIANQVFLTHNEWHRKLGDL